MPIFRLLFIFVFSCLSFSSFASITPITGYQAVLYNRTLPSGYSYSPQFYPDKASTSGQLCSYLEPVYGYKASANNISYQYSGYAVQTVNSQDYCYYYFNTYSTSVTDYGKYLGRFTSSYQLQYQTQNICPSSSSMIGNSCICNSNTKESGNACVPKCPPANTPAGNWEWSYQSYGTSIQINDQSGQGYDGCQINATMSMCASGYSSAVMCVGAGFYTGQEAGTTAVTSSGSESTAHPPSIPSKPSSETYDKIMSGQCPGQVNGTTVWVPCGNSTQPINTPSSEGTTSGTLTTTTNSNGTTTTQQTTTTVNNNGTTTYTTITCTSGQCNTTSTTKDASGQVVSNSTSGGSQGSLCESGSTLPICKASTFGEAACGAIPSCDGDAIQCGIARKQHEIHCLEKKMLDPSQVDGVYENAVNGSDGKNIESMKDGAQTVNIQSLNSGGGGGGSCPPDPQFSVTGESFTIPFSKVCGILNFMSLFAVGVTLIASLTWTVSGKGGE